MAYATEILRYKDKRTGISYASNFDGQFKEEALKIMMEKAEYDYVMSLPAEERAKLKHIDEDFKCPFCHSKKEPTSRKEKVTSGFLFFFSTRIIDIFKCQECDREFEGYQLDNEISYIKQRNYQNLAYEKFRDGKITELEFKRMCGLIIETDRV